MSAITANPSLATQVYRATGRSLGFWISFYAGAAASARLFDKLFDATNYVMIKRFGDYDNLKRPNEERNVIIVALPKSFKKYSYAQSTALTAIAIGASLVVRRILAEFMPSFIATGYLVGSIALSLLAGLTEMGQIYVKDEPTSKWVNVTEEEARERAIDKDRFNQFLESTETASLSKNVYVRWGAPAVHFCGAGGSCCDDR